MSDLQQDAGTVLEKLRASGRPTAIVRDEQAAAVVMSIDAWEQAETERDMLHRSAQGEAEIAFGEGHDLDEVLAEADRLLQSRNA